MTLVGGPTTAVGGAAAAAVLYLGAILVRAAGILAELTRFAVLLWVLGVGAPWISEAIRARVLARR